jgi:hypothetical protein
MTTRARILAFGSAGVLILAGAAAAAIFSGTFGQLLGLVLISVGFVAVMSLVFLEVGLSEDHARAREGATRATPRTLLRRPRLTRMRGRRRRLG